MTVPSTSVVISGIGFAHQAQAPRRNGRLYDDFSLQVWAGSILALMGESGTGKSSLAKIISGIWPPADGEVTFLGNGALDGEIIYQEQAPADNIHPWRSVLENLLWIMRQRGFAQDEHFLSGTKRRLRKTLRGFVTGGTQILHRWRDGFSAGSLMHGLLGRLCKLAWLFRLKRTVTSRTEQEAIALLQAFGLKHRMHALPRNISGGELQRLSLAFYIAWRPKRLLILDEPLSALDREWRKKITLLIRHYACQYQLTILFITHNLTDSLALADRCVVLGGRPVRLLCDVPVDLPFPRLEESPEYGTVQDKLIDVLRHGNF